MKRKNHISQLMLHSSRVKRNMGKGQLDQSNQTSAVELNQTFKSKHSAMYDLVIQ